MNEVEHLLVTLSEECSEVSQAVTKCLRFGLYESEDNIEKYTGDRRNNRVRVSHELCDLIAMVELLGEYGVSDFLVGMRDRDRIEAKKEKVRSFSNTPKKKEP